MNAYEEKNPVTTLEGWRPTHLITVTYTWRTRGVITETYAVMVVDDDGQHPAYSWREWRDDDAAWWGTDAYGAWPPPNGIENGADWTIETLAEGSPQYLRELRFAEAEAEAAAVEVES